MNIRKTGITLILLSIIAISYIGCGGGGGNRLNVLPSNELFTLGKQKYDEEKYLKAIEYFQALVYNYPGESVVDTAQYYLALSYFGQKEYDLAQVEFNRLVLNYPASVFFENSIFMKAVCFYEGTPTHFGLDQSDLKIAIKQFEDFIIDYPESDVIPDVQKYLKEAKTRLAHKDYNSAVTYVRIGTYKAAEIYFQRVVDNYTNTEYGPLATYGLAEVEYKLKKYDEAKSKFQDFTIVYPDHELIPKAKEYIEKSALESGIKAFELNDFSKAKDRFDQFKTEFPDSDKINKVDDYLKKLSAMPESTQEESNDNS